MYEKSDIGVKLAIKLVLYCQENIKMSNISRYYMSCDSILLNMWLKEYIYVYEMMKLPIVKCF